MLKTNKRPTPTTCPACCVGQLYVTRWPNGDRRRVCPACGYQQAADRRVVWSVESVEQFRVEVKQ